MHEANYINASTSQKCKIKKAHRSYDALFTNLKK